MATPLHYQGSYQKRSADVRAAANANPDTRCQRCGRTLAEHPPHRNGTPATWDAGHINDGEVDGPLGPEVSTCNRSAGAQLLADRKRRLNPSRQWV